MDQKTDGVVVMILGLDVRLPVVSISVGVN